MPGPCLVGHNRTQLATLVWMHPTTRDSTKITFEYFQNTMRPFISGLVLFVSLLQWCWSTHKSSLRLNLGVYWHHGCWVWAQSLNLSVCALEIRIWQLKQDTHCLISRHKWWFITSSSLPFVQLFGCKVEKMEYKTLRNRDFKEYTLQVLMCIVVIRTYGIEPYLYCKGMWHLGITHLILYCFNCCTRP